MVTTLQEIVEIKEKSLKEIIPKEQIISITNLEIEIEDDPNDNFPF